MTYCTKSIEAKTNKKIDEWDYQNRKATQHREQ